MKHLLSIFFLSSLPGVFFQTKAQTNDHYTNPLGDTSGDTLFIADPFVLQHQGAYFLYGTSADDGFKGWTSDDLVHWQPIGYVYQRTGDSWGQRNYWAPEVVYYRNKFYLVFSSKGPEDTGMRICLAVSDSPQGPFTDLYVPLFDRGYSCIDGHLFVDGDTPYLYYEMVGAVGEPWKQTGYFWGMIFGTQLAEDLSQPVGSEPKLCLSPDQPWENPTSTLARSTEGMTVFKRDTTYYMTYSANHYTDPQYGVGYATAPSPLGPWTKSANNPILSQDLLTGVSGPGHNSIIRSPDGQELLIVYHSHADPAQPSGNRILNIDRLTVNPDGTLSVVKPTRSPQPVPSSQ